MLQSKNLGNNFSSNLHHEEINMNKKASEEATNVFDLGDQSLLEKLQVMTQELLVRE